MLRKVYRNDKKLLEWKTECGILGIVQTAPLVWTKPQKPSIPPKQMNRLTKFALAATAALTMGSISGYAQYSGIYGVGAVLSSTAAGISALDVYALTDLGDSNLNTTFTPTGGSGQGNSYGASTVINTNDGGGVSTWQDGSLPSLGTFNVATGDDLALNGGEEVTYKGNGANVSQTDLFYSINGGAFQDATLAFNQDEIIGSGGSDNQRWYSDTAANVDLLTGLSNGTYTLSVYFRDNNTVDSNDYISNSGANYNATFTIVPEPSTIAMLLGSGLFGSFYLISRRRK
jgi:hypothetical protein